MMQKVLFCGLGSMGARHLRNLTALLHDGGEVYEMHALRSSPRSLPEGTESLLKRQCYSWDEVEADYDIIFITNPTSEHYSTLKMALNHTRRIFLEKPVFQDIDIPLEGLGLTDGHICYVAAPLRYTRAISFLKEYLSGKKVLGVRAICSSYLPDWRPGTDWRKCYSANASMGGGVDLDLIHEWDYLVYLFGFPQECHALRGRYSDITVDSYDSAVYIASYPQMNMSLHLDYFGRAARRQMEIYMEEDVLLVDFIRGCIDWLKSGESMEVQTPRDEMQTEELRYFLGLKNEKANANTICHAMDVLRLAKGRYGK